MRLKNASHWLIIMIAFFIFSCNTQDDAIIKKDISVSEVQALYQEFNATKSNGRQTNDLAILWDEAQYKDVSTGDALVFPIEASVKKYVRSEGTSTAYPIENQAHAFAYRTEEGTLTLDYVQMIPTAHTELFTGYVTVADWNGDPKHLFRYENGQYLESQNNGRSEDLYCYWIDTQTCTVVTSGGFDYKECENSSTLHCHTIDIPPTIAPGDFADPSGGGGSGRGDGSIELCPHPTIADRFVPCEDLDELPPFGICNYINIKFDRIPGDGTEESFTGEIQNIYVEAIHRPSNLRAEIFWGAWCVTYGTSARNVHSSLDGSNYFKEAWFITTGEIEVWLNAQKVKPTDAQLSNMFKDMFLVNLGFLAGGKVYITGGGCSNTSRTRLRFC